MDQTRKKTFPSIGNTTCIGSLPHHNVDAALSYSFRLGIPFLPQIPIRNPWEYMIAQALESLPGIEIDSDGTVVLDVSIWESRTASFKARIEEAFSKMGDPLAFERFEPHASVSSSWQGFLFELEERGINCAKVQIAGPMTSQWAIQLKHEKGSAPDLVPGLSDQIFRLVLARSIATVRKMKAIGVYPLIYLDEPGLYGLTLANPRHLVALSELKIMIQTLQREGAEVGLHCCSNTDWDMILSLTGTGLSTLSIDTQLSLENLLEGGRAQKVAEFLEKGGRLSLGVIPTLRAAALRSIKVEKLFSDLLETLAQAWPDRPEITRLALREAIYTPACGLAFHSVDDAEVVLEALSEFQQVALRRVQTQRDPLS